MEFGPSSFFRAGPISARPVYPPPFLPRPACHGPRCGRGAPAVGSNPTASASPRPHKRRLGRAPQTLGYFSLPLSLFSPPGGSDERATAGGAERLAGAQGGGGGTADPCSPEVRAAMAGAQLRRAWVAGPLRPAHRARDPLDP